MNIAEFAIKMRKVSYVLAILIVAVGIYAFTQLGRLEMPDFLIKIAVITTPYPGASPAEVEREVTQVIEESIQQLGEIRELYSISQEGLSIVYVEMEQHITTKQLPQIWDNLRRKINDNQNRLPPGAGPSSVNDDFSDVYGVSRSDISQAIQRNFTGSRVGLYRENEELLPIIVRPPEDLRKDYSDIEGIQIRSAATGKYIPLGQITDDLEFEVVEDALIRHRHQMKTITARCTPQGDELASVALKRIKPRIEKEVALPPGYSIIWGGELKSSADAQAPLLKSFPICLALMFLILICQFNRFRSPIVIFGCVPLALIGVGWALLLSGLSFGFMAILGLLGLSGMLIKNGIILIEQIQHNTNEIEMPRFEAVVEAAVSRIRPVCMAAGTTVLGMLPLMWHKFYAAMGATIAGGLIGATFLTLFVVPLFYVILYGIRTEKTIYEEGEYRR